MDKLPTKKFSFAVEIEEVPYRPDTAKALYGGVYTPDFPENVVASDEVHEMVKDAISHVLEMQCNFISKNKIEDTSKLEGRNLAFWQWLQEKLNRYRLIDKSIKPISEEM